MGYSRLQWVTIGCNGYNRLQWVTIGCNGLQSVTVGCNGVTITIGHKWVTVCYGRLQ